MLRVGQLATRAGISVRTLHHYEKLGLIRASREEGSRYRVYDAAQVLRLQQVLHLKRLGLSLPEIDLALRGCSPEQLLRSQLERLREQIQAQNRLCECIQALLEQLRQRGPITLDSTLQLLEEMRNVEKYYSPEQLEHLRQRREAVGTERMRQVGEEWAELMSRVRAEMERGTDPTDERIRPLARKWKALVREFSGGDSGIEASLGRMYAQEEQVHGMPTGPMREMMAWLSQARSDDD